MANYPAMSLVETGEPRTDDQRTFTYILSTLLVKASYPPELQQQYVTFFKNHILPFLEYIPFSDKPVFYSRPPSIPPFWSSNLTHNGSPFEPSRNIQEGKQVLRFCIEPLSSIAGTATDPFNQAASFALVERVQKLNWFPGFDRGLWDYFTRKFFIWEQVEEEAIMRKLEVKNRHLRLRSCLLAFDMQKKGFGLMLKGYVNFFRKAIILEKSPAALIIEAVQGLEGRGDEKIALSKFKEFLVDREGGYEGIQNMSRGNITEVKGLNLVMVSFDFLDALRSRIKIYARSYDLDFATFMETYRMNGFIPISQEELDVFKKFYGAVFGLPEDWDGKTEHVERQNKRHSGVLWQFEFMHGKQLPVIKLYISLWNFVPNDAEAAYRLKTFFKAQSWGLADMYLAEIEELFGAGNMGKEAGRHSYVSYSYTREKGPYLTLYYAPKLAQEI